MIASTQIQRAKLVLYLRRSVVICGAVYFVIACALGAEILLKNGEAKETEHQAMLVAQDAKTTRAEIARADRLEKSTAPTDLSAVARLQSSVERSAVTHECTVVEFRASSEIAPYLTRFAKTTNAAGWAQVETQMSVSGKPHDVMEMLMDLTTAEVPFEYDSLEITRDQTNSVGDATVIAHVTFRVLIRTAKDGL
jgi:hypothetical protein